MKKIKVKLVKSVNGCKQEHRDTVRGLERQVREVFVYFKHEDEGKGAHFGQLMREHLAR